MLDRCPAGCHYCCSLHCCHQQYHCRQCRCCSDHQMTWNPAHDQVLKHLVSPMQTEGGYPGTPSCQSLGLRDGGATASPSALAGWMCHTEREHCLVVPHWHRLLLRLSLSHLSGARSGSLSARHALARRTRVCLDMHSGLVAGHREQWTPRERSHGLTETPQFRPAREARMTAL